MRSGNQSTDNFLVTKVDAVKGANRQPGIVQCHIRE